ncbi:hypothetical protein KI387_005675, partial [Taxus chinensis]
SAAQGSRGTGSRDRAVTGEEGARDRDARAGFGLGGGFGGCPRAGGGAVWAPGGGPWGDRVGGSERGGAESGRGGRGTGKQGNRGRAEQGIYIGYGRAVWGVRPPNTV